MDLELVCGPVAIIKRACFFGFERIAAQGNVSQVPLRRFVDDRYRNRKIALANPRRLLAELIKHLWIPACAGMTQARRPASVAA